MSKSKFVKTVAALTAVPPIRQGDVCLLAVNGLPEGSTPVSMDRGRIVLAYGEVTGHAHAIADHLDAATATEVLSAQSAEVMEAAMARAKARLWAAPSGERYLEVHEPVSLRHEEHTAHVIPVGFWQLPSQVEYTPAELRRVTD